MTTVPTDPSAWTSSRLVSGSLPWQAADVLPRCIPHRLRDAVAVLFLQVIASAQAFDSEPHPTLADRRVAKLDGWTIEYSPIQESFVLPFLARLQQEPWPELVFDQLPPPAPLTGRDFDARRTEFLAAAARGIGLDEPTELQKDAYDAYATYLRMYELNGITAELMNVTLSTTKRLALWDRTELIGRLGRGESIPGFIYNAAKNDLHFQFAVSSDEERTQEKSAQESERKLNRHALEYSEKEGVASVLATVRLKLGSAAQQRKTVSEQQHVREIANLLQRQDLVFPVPTLKDGVALTPEQAAAEVIHQKRIMSESLSAIGRKRYPLLAYTVLHEAVEAGLVDHYIGSRDRRWLCDGMANYLAWTLARDFAGEAAANEIYNLENQLKRAAPYREKVNLTRWPPVERQSTDDRKSELNRAHYAYATRVIFLIAERHGEAFIPRWWQEIGKTPRTKTNMKTVEKAYRKLTGESLRELLKTAMRES